MALHEWTRHVLTVALVLSASASFAQVPSFPPAESLQGRAAGELVTHRGKYNDSEADWGFLLAPEDRQSPGSPLMRLVVVRQRCSGVPTSPAIFNLVGGPGNSNIWGSGEFGPEFLQTSDIVRVGYRGIDSDVELLCPEFTRALQTDHPLSSENIVRVRKALRSCNDSLRAQGIDIDGFNLAEVVEDIESVRRAFGYDRISFFAVSWGTQIAYSYAMRYPDHVQRMLLVGAGGRGRGFDLWDPKMVDKILLAYSARWQSDEGCMKRCPDIIGAIRRVLASLPQQWRHIRIDPDKVRLAMWEMLGESRTAAQVLDAFATAAEGDLSGLALLSWAYDNQLNADLNREHGPYHGEFFSKVFSSGLDTGRDWHSLTKGDGSIIGSPAAQLLWASGSRGGWPIRTIPPEFRRNADTHVPTLVVMGNLDVSAPAEYARRELMPHLKNGNMLVLSDFGHVEFIKDQPQAFERLAQRFLFEGKIDSSGFHPHVIDFVPKETLAGQAQRLWGK